MKVKLPFAVPDWRNALKWLSVQFSILGAVIAATWTMLTPAQQDSIAQFIGLPPGTVVAIGFALVIVGRLKNQPGLGEGFPLKKPE